jgi:HlyD family secretion protein
MKIRGGAMRGLRTIALVIAGVTIVALSLRQACAPRPVAVGTTPATLGVVERLVANSEAGAVRARRVARLAAERAGRVVAFSWREGDVLPAGHLVLQLDPSTAAAQKHSALHDAEAVAAAHREARANAALSAAEYRRISELHGRGVASDENLDAARAKRDATAAALAAAEARDHAADAVVGTRVDELAHLRVRMPFTGVLAQRLVEEGESVLQGQPVAEIMTLDSLYVLAPLDERDAAMIEPGLETRVTLDPFPGNVWHAPVTRVAPVVQETRESNRTLSIEVDLPRWRSGPRPRPGMSADVEIVLERRPDVLRVPTAAVIDNRRVLVLREGRAVERQVTVGLKNWDWTEIRAGLSEGDIVITTLDRSGVRAGARVRADSSATTSR